MNGVVTGGWEYVVAAYVVTGLVLAGLAASTVMRLREELREKARGDRS